MQSEKTLQFEKGAHFELQEQKQPKFEEIIFENHQAQGEIYEPQSSRIAQNGSHMEKGAKFELLFFLKKLIVLILSILFMIMNKTQVTKNGNFKISVDLLKAYGGFAKITGGFDQ